MNHDFKILVKAFPTIITTHSVSLFDVHESKRGFFNSMNQKTLPLAYTPKLLTNFAILMKVSLIITMNHNKNYLDAGAMNFDPGGMNFTILVQAFLLMIIPTVCLLDVPE